MALRPAALACLCLSLLLGGCTTTAVTVEANFPKAPAVERLPTQVMVIFDEQFRNAIVEEEIQKNNNWKFELGNAQIELFRVLFNASFVVLGETDSPEELGDETTNILVIPELEDFQFSIPSLTPGLGFFDQKFFEVWVRYRITVMDKRSGEIIFSELIKGFGRSRDQFKRLSEEDMKETVNRALRDAGADFLIDLLPRISVTDEANKGK